MAIALLAMEGARGGEFWTVTVSGGIATFTNLTRHDSRKHQPLFQQRGVLPHGDAKHHRHHSGPAREVVIHTQPSATATAGKAFGIQPVIYEEDQYGNLETGDNNCR